MIVLFHLIPNILPSGYLAVAIFFVLAGFLSMREIAGREDKVEFKDSFSKIGKKFRKLYPALLILILFTRITISRTSFMNVIFASYLKILILYLINTNFLILYINKLNHLFIFIDI